MLVAPAGAEVMLTGGLPGAALPTSEVAITLSVFDIFVRTCGDRPPVEMGSVLPPNGRFVDDE